MKRIKVRISGVKWVIEDENGEAPAAEDYEKEREALGLPEEVDAFFDEDEEDVLDDLVPDYLSDTYGFLVEGCDYEVVTPELEEAE